MNIRLGFFFFFAIVRSNLHKVKQIHLKDTIKLVHLHNSHQDAENAINPKIVSYSFLVNLCAYLLKGNHHFSFLHRLVRVAGCRINMN